MKRLFWVVVLVVGALVLLNEVEKSPRKMRASGATHNYQRWIGRTVVISGDPEQNIRSVELRDPEGLSSVFVSSCRAVIRDYMPEKDVWVVHVLDGEVEGQAKELEALTCFILTPVQ